MQLFLVLHLNVSCLSVIAGYVFCYFVDHIDGTCRHRERIFSSNYQPIMVTIRSYIWHDTADEPDVQDCSLKVCIHSFFSLDIDEVKLCPQWDFQHFPCQVTAHLREVYLTNDENDYSDSKNVSCNTRAWNSLNKCMPLYTLMCPLFTVRRDRRISDVEQTQDGAMFLQIKAEVKVQKKTYGELPFVHEGLFLRVGFYIHAFDAWTLLFNIRFTPMLPQWQVKDSFKSAGGKLKLNMHTPLTQRS